MPQYIDMNYDEEDERIEAIGKATMQMKKICSFITDDEVGKIERYLKKLKEKFSGIRLISQGKGPIKGTVWAKLGPPAN